MIAKGWHYLASIVGTLQSNSHYLLLVNVTYFLRHLGQSDPIHAQVGHLHLLQHCLHQLHYICFHCGLRQSEHVYNALQKLSNHLVNLCFHCTTGLSSVPVTRLSIFIVPSESYDSFSSTLTHFAKPVS